VAFTVLSFEIFRKLVVRKYVQTTESSQNETGTKKQDIMNLAP